MLLSSLRFSIFLHWGPLLWEPCVKLLHTTFPLPNTECRTLISVNTRHSNFAHFECLYIAILKRIKQNRVLYTSGFNTSFTNQHLCECCLVLRFGIIHTCSDLTLRFRYGLQSPGFCISFLPFSDISTLHTPQFPCPALWGPPVRHQGLPCLT